MGHVGEPAERAERLAQQATAMGQPEHPPASADVMLQKEMTRDDRLAAAGWHNDHTGLLVPIEVML